MRTFTLLLLSLSAQLFHLGSVAARAERKYTPRSFVGTRTTPSRRLDVIASRQHHEPRQLLDVCAKIDTPDILSGDLLGIPLDDIIDLDLCLCLSAFPLVLELDVDLKLLSDKYGASLVDAVLKLLIDTVPGSRHCSYPAHSQQLCEADDPCGFSCDSPYVKQGDQCVCAPPNSMCNGVCGSFPSGCGSAVPRALVGRADGVSNGRFAAAQTCKSHETASACGVLNGKKSAYDCVDTNTDLESCGGCMVQSALKGSDTRIGKDCTSIEGVHGVSCVSGSCSVTSCKDGWLVNSDGNGCSQDRTSAASAFNVAAAAMEYSALGIRSPLKARPEPKDGPKDEPKSDGEDAEMHSVYYSSAWYAQN